MELIAAVCLFVAFATIWASSRGIRPLEPPSDLIELDVIDRREPIGSYLGNKIYKYVTLSDGITYEFVSVAVPAITPDGVLVYHADLPGKHVKIDGDLLYRELQG